MALNKTILGDALYAVWQKYDDKTRDELITQFGTIENARKQMAKDEAEAIIDHIQAYAQVDSTLAPGLSANGFPVIGITAVQAIK